MPQAQYEALVDQIALACNESVALKSLRQLDAP